MPAVGCMSEGSIGTEDGSMKDGGAKAWSVPIFEVELNEELVKFGQGL